MGDVESWHELHQSTPDQVTLLVSLEVANPLPVDLAVLLRVPTFVLALLPEREQHVLEKASRFVQLLSIRFLQNFYSHRCFICYDVLNCVLIVLVVIYF